VLPNTRDLRSFSLPLFLATLYALNGLLEIPQQNPGVSQSPAGVVVALPPKFTLLREIPTEFTLLLKLLFDLFDFGHCDSPFALIKVSADSDRTLAFFAPATFSAVRVFANNYRFYLTRLNFVVY